MEKLLDLEFSNITRKETLSGIYYRYFFYGPPILILFLLRHHLPFPYPQLSFVSLAGLIGNVVCHQLLVFNPRTTFAISKVSSYFDACIVAPLLYHFSGGFLSPFIIAVYGSAIGGAMVYNRDKAFRNGIILCTSITYLAVAFLHKSGMLINQVSYSAAMMQNDHFFYFIIITISGLFYSGPMIVSSMFQLKLGEMASIYQILGEGIGSTKKKKLFPAITKNIALLLNVDISFIGILDKEKRSIKIVSYWYNGFTTSHPFMVTLTDHPLLREVLGKNCCISSDGSSIPDIIKAITGDDASELMRSCNLTVLSLRNSRRNAVGLLGVLFTKPIENQTIHQKILRIFASRAEAELERQRAERDKIRMQDRMFQSQKMEAVGKLAGGVAHDFNNLLTAIMGYGTLIKRKSAPDSPVFEFAGKILSVSEKAADLISKLLTYARKDNYVQTDVAMHTLIKDCVNIIDLTSKKAVRTELNLQAHDHQIRGNPSQLNNMFLNICINAVDAMPSGGELRILTENRVVNHGIHLKHAPFKPITPHYYLTITIIDTGTGITEDALPHIFEPFFTTKESGKGTGLGLAAAYGCIKKLNGYIDVDSTPGRGTTFTIYLPTEKNRALAPLPAVKTEEEIVSHSCKGTLLIVDDDTNILDVLKNTLMEYGYQIYAFASPREAFEFYQNNAAKIHLVLLDMMMPEMNGYQLFSLLRNIAPKTKALILSGYSEGEAYQQILDDGALEVLIKPVDFSLLSQKIAQYII